LFAADRRNAMREGDDDQGDLAALPIVTRRLLLRSPDSGERTAIARLAANPRVAENLAAAPSDRAGAFFGSFAVIERQSGSVLGGAAFGPMADLPASAEIAAFLGEPFWGKGYATEATQALIDHIFASAPVMVLWCANRASNTRARRVIEKCGFQFRGAGMVRAPGTNGAVPVERFILDRRTWESIKAWGAGGQKRRPPDAPHHTAA
jgi:GNAT superfamily N-acetyltransferase